VLLSLPSTAQAPAPPIQGQHQQERFVKQEVMITMRDGVHLQTVIFTPKQSSGPLPILLRRTPYGVPESERRLDSGIYEDLIADGYIFVSQNIRGRFKSEGTFIMQRLPRDRSKPNSIDEGTDAYDTIDWLIKNVPNITITVASACGEFPTRDGW
jgi:predicted acyl esterase